MSSHSIGTPAGDCMPFLAVNWTLVGIPLIFSHAFTVIRIKCLIFCLTILRCLPTVAFAFHMLVSGDKMSVMIYIIHISPRQLTVLFPYFHVHLEVQQDCTGVQAFHDFTSVTATICFNQSMPRMVLVSGIEIRIDNFILRFSGR